MVDLYQGGFDVLLEVLLALRSFLLIKKLFDVKSEKPFCYFQKQLEVILDEVSTKVLLQEARRSTLFYSTLKHS